MQRRNDLILYSGLYLSADMPHVYAPDPKVSLHAQTHMPSFVTRDNQVHDLTELSKKIYGLWIPKTVWKSENFDNGRDMYHDFDLPF